MRDFTLKNDKGKVLKKFFMPANLEESKVYDYLKGLGYKDVESRTTSTQEKITTYSELSRFMGNSALHFLLGAFAGLLDTNEYHVAGVLGLTAFSTIHKMIYNDHPIFRGAIAENTVLHSIPYLLCLHAGVGLSKGLLANQVKCVCIIASVVIAGYLNHKHENMEEVVLSL